MLDGHTTQHFRGAQLWTGPLENAMGNLRALSESDIPDEPNKGCEIWNVQCRLIILIMQFQKSGYATSHLLTHHWNISLVKSSSPKHLRQNGHSRHLSLQHNLYSLQSMAWHRHSPVRTCTPAPLRRTPGACTCGPLACPTTLSRALSHRNAHYVNEKKKRRTDIQPQSQTISLLVSHSVKSFKHRWLHHIAHAQ